MWLQQRTFVGLEKINPSETTNKLQVGDLVFVHDPDSGVFEPRYSPNYRIIAIHRANRIEVQDEKGHKSVRRAGHVKKVEPVDKMCHQLPPEEVYKQFGRASKLLIHTKNVPNIKLLSSEKAINRMEEVAEVREEVSHCCQIDNENKLSDGSEELINTVERKEIKHTSSQEQWDEHNSKSDNSEKSINHGDFAETSSGNKGKNIGMEPTQLHDKSDESLKHWCKPYGFTL